MADDYATIRTWAVHNVPDLKMRRKIRRDIDKEWATNNTKAISVYTFLYRLGEAENLPNTVQGIIPKDRVRTETLHSCRACGTLHGDGYRCSPAKGKDREDLDFFIGYVCARKRLARYGLNVGVLAEVDEQSTSRKKRALHEDLAELVLSEDGPAVQLAGLGPSERDEAFIGSQLNWLLQYSGKLAENVQLALKNLRDPYYRPTRAELNLVLQTVAKLRTFPADAYEPVAQDVELMEAEQLAPAGLAKRLRQHKRLTAKKAEKLLSTTKRHYRAYRIEKNTTLVQQYDKAGKSLATILGEIIPSLQHDQPLWHEDLVRQRYLYNKVWAPADYTLAKHCITRWAFGEVKHLEGADRLKLRNIALRLESVPEFKRKLEGLVVLSRKLAYAHAHLKSDEYEKLKAAQEALAQLPDTKKYAAFKKSAAAIAEEIKDPCALLRMRCIPIEAFSEKTELGDLDDVLAKIERSYAAHDKTWMHYHVQLARVKEHKEYRILTKDDLRVIKNLHARVESFLRLDEQFTEETDLKNVRDLQEAARNPLTQAITYNPEKERRMSDHAAFGNADSVNKEALSNLQRTVRKPHQSNRVGFLSAAADDARWLLHELQGVNAAAQEVLDWTHDVEAFGKNPLIYEANGNDIAVVEKKYATIDANDITVGTFVRFISPEKVKALKGRISGMMRLKKLAADAEFRRDLETVLTEYKPEYVRYSDDKKMPIRPVVDYAHMRQLFSDAHVALDTDERPVFVHAGLKENARKLVTDLPYHRAAWERRVFVETEQKTKDEWKIEQELKDLYLDKLSARVKNDAVLCRLINGLAKNGYWRESLQRDPDQNKDPMRRLFLEYSMHRWTDFHLEYTLNGEDERLGNHYQHVWNKQLDWHARPAGNRQAMMTEPQYEKLFKPAIGKLCRIADETLLTVLEPAKTAT